MLAKKGRSNFLKMEIMNRNVSLEEDLSDFRMAGIRCLREMKNALNEKDKGSFDVAFSDYKNHEKNHYKYGGEMFPERIDKKYANIMMAGHNF